MKDNNNSFSYSYSGATNDELQKLKEKYTQSETNQKLAEIKKLDTRVDFIATMVAIFTGLMATAFIIAGVIFLIKDRFSTLTGIMLTAPGVIIIAVNPLLYSKIHECVKAHYSSRILSLIKDIEQNRI